MKEKNFYVKINNNNDNIITVEISLRYFRYNILKSVPIDYAIRAGRQLIIGLK